MSFKYISIPKEVWVDERLTALDKIIMSGIIALRVEEWMCYKSNSEIAEFCQCSETQVSKSISKLIKLGYLCVVCFNGRERQIMITIDNF